jgi:hypothetical protein
MTEPKHVTPIALPTISKAAAKKNQIKLRGEYRQLERSWFKLGRSVGKAIHRGEHTALRLTIDEWMQDTFMDSSPAKLWRALRSTKALAGLADSVLDRLTESSAYELAKLPEKMRKSEEYIDKAATMPVDEFKKEVADVLAKKHPEPKEEFRTWALRVPLSVYEMLKAAEAHAAEAMQLDISDADGKAAGRKILIWERVAHLLSETGLSHLQALMAGDEPAAGL